MNSRPRVSIITPLYNCAEYIGDTIRSVIAQSFGDWELLLVDDASTDDSVSAALQAADGDARIRIIQLEQNSGAAVARNTAIEQATGRFIAFIDSDDVWAPQKLEAQLAFMEETGAELSYTSYRFVDERGEPTGRVFEAHREMTLGTLLKTNYIGCSTAMYDTKRIGKQYMPLLRKRQDYGLWLSILSIDGVRAMGLAEVLTSYRVRPGSVSSNKLKAAAYNWRLYREVMGFGLIKSLWYFGHYAVIAVLRRS